VSTSDARGPGSKHLDVAAANADLGLPARRRNLPKRMLGRAMWIFGRHQVKYNHAMLEAVRDLVHAVEALRTAIPEQVGNDVGSVRSQVGSLEIDVRTLQARVQELADRLGALDRASDAPSRAR
jgi:hypothetical protein